MSEAVPRQHLTISYGEACDRGKVREENQDSVRRATMALGELFVVADGIGGYQGGATASRMVVEGFHTQLATRPANYPAKDALRQASAYTNAAIREAAHRGDPSLQSMGSTVVLALLHASGEGMQMALIGHIGDSRAYLIRNGQMRKVTSDHSAVQALLSRNLLTEEEARNHPDASVLTRSLGHRLKVEIEIDEVPLQPGDALLLCSDGLWGYVSDGDISAVATDGELSAQTVADTLLHLALAAGGQDNIGIEFIRVGNGIAATAAPLTTTISESRAASSAEAGTHRARTQLGTAVALLLLAACGYWVYAAHRHAWPFLPAAPELKTDSAKRAGAAVTPTAPAAPVSGQTEKPATGEQKRPPPTAVAGLLRKSILVVGGVAEGGDEAASPANTIRWKHVQFTRESKPACARLAETAPVLYAAPQVNLLEMLAQHPELLVTLRSLTPRPIDAKIQRACGSYDVILILPRSGVGDGAGR